MTLTQLEYIIAVEKHKHFGKAAESCFVTQPTLSMQIQKLEDQLQVRIFDRTHSPVKVTTEGEVILKQAYVILREQQRMLDLLDASKEELQGNLIIGVIPTLSSYIIPLFVSEFNEAYPKVNLIIEEMKTEDIIEALEKGTIDCGLLVTPLERKNILEKVLYYEPFHLFVSENHSLYKRKRVKEDDLDINEIWMLNKGNCFRDQVINICSQDIKPSENIHFESGNFETLKKMVIHTGGYTLIPHTSIEDLNNKQKEMVRSFIRPQPTREVSLVYPKGYIKESLIDALELEILAGVPSELKKFNKREHEIISI